MTQPFNIEIELQKIVALTEIICATETFTVNWEDILSELEAYMEKGYAPCDTACFTADIVQVIRERAEYSERFITFDTTGEAAEYLALYSLCKVGIASTGENPAPFLEAALKAQGISVNEHLGRALTEAATSSITENGEDELPPLIDASLLLLDETGALSALICQARELIEDPAWVAHIAVERTCKSIAKTLEM